LFNKNSIDHSNNEYLLQSIILRNVSTKKFFISEHRLPLNLLSKFSFSPSNLKSLNHFNVLVVLFIK